MFQFYSKNDGLRITDLHQGIVWGTNTPQTIRDKRLVNRFDYDSDYGTVLNRCIQRLVFPVAFTRALGELRRGRVLFLIAKKQTMRNIGGREFPFLWVAISDYTSRESARSVFSLCGFVWISLRLGSQ